MEHLTKLDRHKSMRPNRAHWLCDLANVMARSPNYCRQVMVIRRSSQELDKSKTHPCL